MPVPVSVTADADIVAGRERGRVRVHAVEPRVGGGDRSSLPPSGMASRALMARLSSALSSWLGSTQRQPQILRRDDREVDGLADGPAQQILHARHQLIGIDGLRIQRSAAGQTPAADG